MRIDLIAFDADDTLWVNEPRYHKAEAKLKAILSLYASGETVAEYLHAAEIRNLETLGYGVKAYILTMLETALAISQERLNGPEIAQILQVGREMLTMPVHLFEYVEETLLELSQRKDLIVITKGDLMEQQGLLARSGLLQYFRAIEIVSEKNEAVYQDILVKHRVTPDRFMMVGNSLRSDILPVAAIGAHAVYIHYEDTWQHEKNLPYQPRPDTYRQIEHIGLLTQLIQQLEAT